MKKRYKGMFSDWFFYCDAETEEEAQKILKKQLIREIKEDDEPFIVWEE